MLYDISDLKSKNHEFELFIEDYGEDVGGIGWLKKYGSLCRKCNFYLYQIESEQFGVHETVMFENWVYPKQLWPEIKDHVPTCDEVIIKNIIE